MLSKLKNVFLIAFTAILFVFGQSLAQATQPAIATATLLPSGQFLQSGGKSSDQVVGDLSIYDAVADKTTPLTYKLVTPRTNHTATVLPDGKVLILGGVGQDGYPVASAEIIDLAAQKIQAIANPGLIARSQHRATLLTNGKVLITGGLSADNQPVSQAEMWNPKTQQAESLHADLLTPRYNHAAQLLSNSPILIQGGQDASGNKVDGSELYDTQTQAFGPANGATTPDTHANPQVAEIIPPADSFDINVDSWIVVRFNKPLKVDTLNASTVTLLGPTGQAAIKVVPAEAGMLVFITPTQALLPGSKYTLFIDGATDSQGLLLPFTASSFTTVATSDNGGDSSGAVSGDAGQTASSSGSGSGSSSSSQGSSASTTTAANTANPSAQDAAAAANASNTSNNMASNVNEEWIPSPENYKGEWHSHRAHLAKLFPPKRIELQIERQRIEYYNKSDKLSEKLANQLKKQLDAYIKTGITSVSGQALRLNGRPLAGVTMSIGGVRTTTDSNGEFLLANVPAGDQTMVIEGGTADQGNHHYGRYEYSLYLKAGQINPMSQPIWMTLLDTKYAVRIGSPTTRETVITNPKLPGLELRIPAGAVIRDAAGDIVDEVSITPVPSDQLPFPMPYGELPVYFTIQPGGALVQSVTGRPLAAKLIYPNYTTQPHGARFELFGYDPYGRGWYSYGIGKVTDDGKYIKGDSDFLIYQFKAAGAASNGGTPAAKNPANCTEPTCACPPGGTAGDPVSCHEGLFMENNTDLTIRDVEPISVFRTYRNEDANQRAFGVGTNDLYDLYLYFVNPTGHSADAIDVILPSGGNIRFNPTGTSTDYGSTSTVFESTTPGQFYKAKLYTSGGYGTDFYVDFKDGSRYAFTYSSSRLKWMQDRWGNRTAITRDGSNRVTNITSPHGRYVNFEYNSPYCTACITKATDNTGRSFIYDYDTAGHLWQVTDPETNVTQYSFDPSTHRMLTVKNPRNVAGEVSQPKVTNEYYTSADGTNLDGRVKKQTYADLTTNNFAYTFDANGNLTQTDVTRERGDLRRIEYNTDGFITRETLALGQPEQQVIINNWDSTTKLLNSTTDALNRVTVYGYDGMGNVKSITKLQGTPEEVTWNFTYEPTYNQVATITDPLNRTIQFTYDGPNLTDVKNLGNNTHTSMSYTAEGQLSTQTAYVGTRMLTTTYGYEGGDLTAITDPLNRTTRFFTDSLGRIVAVTDPMNQVSYTEYDTLDRVRTTTDALNNITQYAYDPDSNLKSLTDAKLHATSYTYDARDRVQTMTDPLLKTEYYAYDEAGNLKQVTDRKGQVSGFLYDFLNRRTFEGYGATAANPTAYTRTVNTIWDAGNRVKQITDSQSGTISRDYTGLDLLKQEITPQGEVDYTYYANGLRHTQTVLGQPAITYTYDNGNRPYQIIQGTSVVTLGFDDANRRTSLTLPNGISLTYTLDDASQVKQIDYTRGVTVIGSITYDYDPAGRRTQMGGSLARGNLPQAMTALYDDANRQTQFNGRTLNYDDNGNLTSDGLRAFTWDAANRLTQLTGSATASFQYDPMGRRISKTVAGNQTGYLYDGINPVQELAGTTPTANLLTGGVDEYFTRTDATGTRSYVTDALGSVLALSDATGALNTQYSYDPYGNTTRTGEANTNSYQYTGRENDGTGLYYYRARYYDPELSRFVQSDPIGLAGGINTYAYANSNPVSFTDPLGLKAFCLPGMKCWSDIPDPTESIPPKSPKQPESPIGPNAKPKGEECTHFLPSVSGCTACCAKMNRMNPNMITPCVINYCTDPAGITLIKPPEMCSVASATGGSLPW